MRMGGGPSMKVSRERERKKRRRMERREEDVGIYASVL